MEEGLQNVLPDLPASLLHARAHGGLQSFLRAQRVEPLSPGLITVIIGGRAFFPSPETSQFIELFN